MRSTYAASTHARVVSSTHAVGTQIVQVHTPMQRVHTHTIVKGEMQQAPRGTDYNLQPARQADCMYVASCTDWKDGRG